jgi:hypothetical protein
MNTIGKWDKPVELPGLDVAFGPKNGIASILPAWEEIPEDFREERGEAKKWIEKIDDMFFKGVGIKVIVMKPGVERNTAMRQLQCILHSFEPKHEHKTAGAAYLMSLWFEKFEYTVKK